MKIQKALKVNFSKGTIKGGIAKGEPAVVIDYTLDGVKWLNHGVYCRRFLGEIDRIKADLLEVGPITSRAEVIFPRDCSY